MTMCSERVLRSTGIRTDNVGEYSANVALSQRRAETVAATLAGDYKIPAQRMLARGFVLRIGNPYGAQLASTRALGQLHAVPPVRLDSVTRAPRDLRGRNDLAPIALDLQGTPQPETCQPS